MGLFADTYEDNTEFEGQIAGQNESGFLPVMKETRSDKQVPKVTCPVCRMTMREPNLNRHIHNKHAGNHLYVRVNGVVIPSDVVVLQKPDDVEVVCIGWKGVAAEISCGQKLAGSFKIARENTSLLSLVTGGQCEDIEIRLKHASQEKTFHIYVGKQPAFNGKHIDQLAYDLLFKPLHCGNMPSVQEFKSKASPVNELEHRYMAGLCDYAVAVIPGTQFATSKILLERAYTQLESFVTSFAVSTRNALAFRMNLFDMLKQCRQSSHFYLANMFFNDGMKRSKRKTLHDSGDQHDYGVFIDQFTESYLECLAAYVQCDYTFAKTKLLELQDCLDKDDPNNMVKLRLLVARVSTELGERPAAMDAYYDLKDHEMFGKEAKSYIHEHN